MKFGFMALGLWVAGCASESPPLPTDAACIYPDAPKEMAPNEVIPAYSWPEAIAFGGEAVALSLESVFCEPDAQPFGTQDVLLFVSVPAW